MNLKYLVDNESSGKTVKYILKIKMELSERLTKKLKYDCKILKNASPAHINDTVYSGDLIEVYIDFIEECDDIIPEDLGIDIIYEDESLIAVNKQPGIVVHPTSSHLTGTIANGVMYHFKQQGIHKKIRPVSRLDRDTTGVIIFAKNQFVQEALIKQMNDKSFEKEYIGVVHGNMEENKGTIDLPIERKPGSIMLRHTSPTGSPSMTHYEVLEQFHNASFLKFILETGRTHQIRVHCQAIGHPLIGDTLYPGDYTTDHISRQALHSRKVSFTHPTLKNSLIIEAPIPPDINKLLEILKK